MHGVNLTGLYGDGVLEQRKKGLSPKATCIRRKHGAAQTRKHTNTEQTRTQNMKTGNFCHRGQVIPTPGSQTCLENESLKFFSDGQNNGYRYQ